VNSKTTITFSLLVIAVASLFALDPILGNQQAMVAGGFEGSLVSGGGAAGFD
jgi:hypothetical protein